MRALKCERRVVRSLGHRRRRRKAFAYADLLMEGVAAFLCCPTRTEYSSTHAFVYVYSLLLMRTTTTTTTTPCTKRKKGLDGGHHRSSWIACVCISCVKIKSICKCWTM